jgi:sigma-E factor negative regulatory protein RseC
MMETRARVIRVEPGYAWVESERRSGCSHCGSRESCGVSSLGKLFAVRIQRTRLPDPLGVQTGEDVVLGLSEQRLVAAASIAYMLPVFIMIATALLSSGLGHGQGSVAMSSVVGLIGGLWLVRHLSCRKLSFARYQPVILRRQRADEFAIELKPRNTGVHHE